MVEYKVELDEVFPRDRVTVRGEDHRYIVYDTSSGTDAKDEYILDKAPIDSLIEVTGTLNGGNHTFVKGTDYELSNDSERIVWLSGDRPDAGTFFFVDYEAQPVIDRYINQHDSELQTTKDNILASIDANFVDKASGQQLDEIGAVFGKPIGDRAGRSDSEYRTYLKQVVRAYKSRGTTDDIKTVVSVTEGIQKSNITIEENFEAVQYNVRIDSSQSYDEQRVQQAAEIADPSGVELGEVLSGSVETLEISGSSTNTVSGGGDDLGSGTLGADKLS